ncbi:hypothetical protein CHELA40_10505 [Chelatococcus asaccharovorans]|nr:hypothetical protein CHELA40_10505 [Chelatococcus asaccharovorans]
MKAAMRLQIARDVGDDRRLASDAQFQAPLGHAGLVGDEARHVDPLMQDRDLRMQFDRIGGSLPEGRRNAGHRIVDRGELEGVADTQPMQDIEGFDRKFRIEADIGARAVIEEFAIADEFGARKDIPEVKGFAPAAMDDHHVGLKARALQKPRLGCHRGRAAQPSAGVIDREIVGLMHHWRAVALVANAAAVEFPRADARHIGAVHEKPVDEPAELAWEVLMDEQNLQESEPFWPLVPVAFGAGAFVAAAAFFEAGAAGAAALSAGSSKTWSR